MGQGRENPPQRLAPIAAGGICKSDAASDRAEGDRPGGAGDAVGLRRVGKAFVFAACPPSSLATLIVGALPPSLFELRRTLCRSYDAVIPGWCASTRPQMRNCASGNLEIPGSMFTHRPGMTVSVREQSQPSLWLRHDPDI